jgi:hypothetical protein
MVILVEDVYISQVRGCFTAAPPLQNTSHIILELASNNYPHVGYRENMDSILALLKDTPIPTILVLSGVVFLFLALAGQIAGKLEVPPARQKWAAAAGVVFLGAGLLLYLAPGLPRVSQAEDSPSQIPAAATQSTSSSGLAQSSQQDMQGAENNLASTTQSAVDNNPALGDFDECLKDLLSGIPADRVIQVESGARSKELLGVQQTKSDPAGIVLLDLGQPIAALTYVFVEDDLLFKIGSVVDGACQPAEYVNAARGGDPNVLQNNDWMDMTYGSGVYTLRFNYYTGVVTLDTSKLQQ